MRIAFFIVMMLGVNAFGQSTSCDLFFTELLNPDCDKPNCRQFRVYTTCKMKDYGIKIFNPEGRVWFKSFNVDDIWEPRPETKGELHWLITYTDSEGKIKNTRGKIML